MHEAPARLDFYRARVVDGLGQVIHERLFTVELGETGCHTTARTGRSGRSDPGLCPRPVASRSYLLEPNPWLHENALRPFLDEVCAERLAQVEHIGEYVDLSLTEVLQRHNEEIGRAQDEK